MLVLKNLKVYVLQQIIGFLRQQRVLQDNYSEFHHGSLRKYDQHKLDLVLVPLE